MAKKHDAVDIDGKMKKSAEAEAEVKEKAETAAENRKAEQESEASDAETVEAETGAGEAENEEAGTEKKDPAQKKIDELTDKYMRLFAEFDNFRKRNEQEKAGRFAEGEKTVLLKLLPVVDNFERALQSMPEEEKQGAFAEGIAMIYKNLQDVLKDAGVTPIEAVGKEFDANLHNAVMHIEDESLPENTIAEEFQKGYLFHDKVLRYSMVKVAN